MTYGNAMLENWHGLAGCEPACGGTVEQLIAICDWPEEAFVAGTMEKRRKASIGMIATAIFFIGETLIG